MRARHYPMAPFNIAPAILALALGSALAAALAQEAPDVDGSQDPLPSLVLVLNVISDTHARPVTGVVIRTVAPGPAPVPALVLVPADFVSPGDEIIVLDGGTDIPRNGRASRTVARSVQAGAALLEVAGLERAGVEFASGPWPPQGNTEFEFVAWPPAEALAEGAPLIRRSLRFDGSVLAPAPPDVSGLLFDRCGRLAALHHAGDEGRLAGAVTLAQYLASAGFGPVQAPCFAAATETPAAEVALPEVNDGHQPALSAAEHEPGSGEPAAVGAAAEKPGRLQWVAAALIALSGLALGVGLAARRRRPALWLQGNDPDNRAARLPLRFRGKGGRASLQRMGHSVAFQLSAGRLLVSDDRGGEAPTRLALALGGTPCLPGEVFIAEPGQVIRLGAESWVVNSDRDQPSAMRVAG